METTDKYLTGAGWYTHIVPSPSPSLLSSSLTNSLLQPFLLQRVPAATGTVISSSSSLGGEGGTASLGFEEVEDGRVERNEADMPLVKISLPSEDCSVFKFTEVDSFFAAWGLTASVLCAPVWHPYIKTIKNHERRIMLKKGVSNWIESWVRYFLLRFWCFCLFLKLPLSSWTDRNQVPVYLHPSSMTKIWDLRERPRARHINHCQHTCIQRDNLRPYRCPGMITTWAFGIVFLRELFFTSIPSAKRHDVFQRKQRLVEERRWKEWDGCNNGSSNTVSSRRI